MPDVTVVELEATELNVLAAIPKPPVSVAVAAPLARAAVAWGPSDGIDRLSLLPEVILRNIVSRLPVKDGVRTTVLSTRWRRIWHSVPLSFVDAHHLPSPDLAATVFRALAAHPGPFRCVSLANAFMDKRLAAAIKPLLRILSSKGIKDLVLVNCTGTMGGSLSLLPDTIFKCTSLTSLYIAFWDFPYTARLPPSAVFPQLRELRLGALLIEERDLAFLIERCPVLAKLMIVGSKCPVVIRIRSRSLRCVQICSSITPSINVGHTPRLERLLLWGAWGIGAHDSMSCVLKIGHAPHLRFLGFLVPGMHHLVIGDTIIKAETQASPTTTVSSVQMLAIQLNLEARSEAELLPSFLRCFPNTETLYIQCVTDGPHQPILKLWNQAAPIECVQQHIKKLVLRLFQGKRGEIDFLKFIAEHANALEEVVLIIGHVNFSQVAKKLQATLSAVKWASLNVRMTVLQASAHQEGTPWCFSRAFDLANGDPFAC